MARQVVLDTETTGLETSQDHRIIEIGCVELVNRRLTGRHYHKYINPEREIDQGAMEVHGITNEYLADKPVFASVANEFLDFIRGSELVIHNAPFDHEFGKLNDYAPVANSCDVIDTLVMARQRHPGQKNNLNALCKRYGVDNSKRDLHGALLDAEILADVYLLMTGGQVDLVLGSHGSAREGSVQNDIRRLSSERSALKIIRASEVELEQHNQKLAKINKASDGACVWLAASSDTASD